MNDPENFREALDLALSELGEPRTKDAAIAVISRALTILVVTKGKRYGKDNILKFGLRGIVIRTYDKIERGINHLFNGAPLGKEGMLDTMGDISGYGIIGVLLEKNWFDLPYE